MCDDKCVYGGYGGRPSVALVGFWDSFFQELSTSARAAVFVLLLIGVTTSARVGLFGTLRQQRMYPKTT